MTDTGGDATAAFVAALRTASAALAEVPGRLEGARVHDRAFGKLFEAGQVRDAYHQRLPETEKDVAEAREVIEHFVAGLTGGHPIGPRVQPAVPGFEADAESGVAAPASEAPEASASPAQAIVPSQPTGESAP